MEHAVNCGVVGTGIPWPNFHLFNLISACFLNSNHSRLCPFMVISGDLKQKFTVRMRQRSAHTDITHRPGTFSAFTRFRATSTANDTDDSTACEGQRCFITCCSVAHRGGALPCRHGSLPLWLTCTYEQPNHRKGHQWHLERALLVYNR